MSTLYYFNKLLIARITLLILLAILNLKGQSEMTPVNPEMQTLFKKIDLDGWILLEENDYNRDNLYDYIDGGAELYHSYGFQHLITRTYQRAGQPDVVVDVFDMGNASNAFGIFSHSREELSVEFGQGSQYTLGLLQFWKGRYYVSILASPETAESKAAAYQIARYIEKEIKSGGELPHILAYLPEKNLLPATVRYFTHHAWQNTYYFISSENIFNITVNTEAVLAKYQDSGILMLIKYSREQEAKDALDNYLHYFAVEEPGKNSIRLEDRSWTGARVSGRLLIMVYSAPQETAVRSLLSVFEN